MPHQDDAASDKSPPNDRLQRRLATRAICFEAWMLRWCVWLQCNIPAVLGASNKINQIGQDGTGGLHATGP